MENQIENQNQRIEVIEDSIQRIIKTLITDYKALHENFADYKAQKERETEENRKFLEFLEQNNRAMEGAQRINQSHFEAQDYIKEQTEVLKRILDKAFPYSAVDILTLVFLDDYYLIKVHYIDPIPVVFALNCA